jgi:hypothetical protein
MDLFQPQFKYIKDLMTWLGKYEWITASRDPSGEYKIQTAMPVEILDQPDGPWFNNMVRTAIMQATGFNTVASDLYTFFVWSKHLAAGPKRFSPTYEQCIVMEQMELNIPCNTYTQSFPTVGIDFPKQYQDQLSAEHGIRCPTGMLAHRFDIGSTVLVSVIPDVVSGDFVKLFPGSPDLMEDEIKSSELLRGMNDMPETEWRLSRRLERLTLNLNLLLCNFPINLNIIDLKRKKEIEAKLSAPNRTTRREAKIEYDLEPKSITFSQQIKLFDTEGEPETGEPRPHGSPAPHWRKGHWKRQRHGTALREVKTIFVRPVLVNKVKFVGDVKDTSTTYKG